MLLVQKQSKGAELCFKFISETRKDKRKVAEESLSFKHQTAEKTEAASVALRCFADVTLNHFLYHVVCPSVETLPITEATLMYIPSSPPH